MAARSSGADSDSLRRYLEEVGAYPLLTAEDEGRLASQIIAGREAAALLENGSPTTAEKVRLKRAVRDGEDARTRFINSNLRLVISIARRFDGGGLSVLDLVQEGNLGLMRAVEKFDHTKGFKFSTYATWWIRQAIGRALADGSRTIRVPSHVRETYSLIDQSTEKLAEQLDRPPTSAEIAKHTGLSKDHVDLARQHRNSLVSLSAPIGSEGDSDLGDLIADDQAEAAYDDVIRRIDRRVLDAQLSRLSERERDVISLRFGLNDEPCTLAEIGDRFELTRERIRQIEARALGKLRHPSVRRLWPERAKTPVPA